jgi:hypothetical protein
MDKVHCNFLSDRKLLNGILAMIVTGLCLSLPSLAVSDDAPFDSLTISLNYIHNSNRNLYHHFWHPSHGAELGVETPFYFGIAEGGVQYVKSRSWMPEQPDFWTLYSYLGWGLSGRLTGRLNLYTGFNLGNIYFRFDDSGINEAARAERELGFGIKMGLRYEFSEYSYLYLSLRRRVIFTSNRIKQDFISVGLGKSLCTPRWLKEFLN